MYRRSFLLALAAVPLAACVAPTESTRPSGGESAYRYGRFTVEVGQNGQRILGGQFAPPAAMPVASSARHAILVNYTTKELLYYRGGAATLGFAVVTPDASYLPRQIVRGRVSGIEMRPSWGPTDNIRRAYAAQGRPLPAGDLPYGHPQNPMGDAKFLIGWDVGGWDYVRLHGSDGYPAGNFWNAETFGCVNLLNPAMSQLLVAMGGNAIREGIEVVVYRQ